MGDVHRIPDDRVLQPVLPEGADKRLAAMNANAGIDRALPLPFSFFAPANDLALKIVGCCNRIRSISIAGSGQPKHGQQPIAGELVDHTAVACNDEFSVGAKRY